MPDNPLGLLGYMPGQISLLPQRAPAVPQGAARPFAPGEFLNNPNGSWSNEMSYTLMDPLLNGGLPTNVPGLWIKDGRPYHATEDEAAQLALQSGLLFPTYQRLPEAQDAAAEREKDWQRIPRERASSVRPLYVPGLLSGK